MDSVGVETGSYCAGDGVVAFCAVDLGDGDLDVHACYHFDVGELPDVELVDVIHTINLKKHQ